ncbi:unnamed protein product [Chironomus riparius]|uniref:Uncharacterized protein n=1 Tax=Chironomus riparius TaxID=315576 RepID=A0A9N9S6A7_9DIPT|nr:unnamed protein product [Chironomus riparius]
MHFLQFLGIIIYLQIIDCNFIKSGYYKDNPWYKFEMKMWTFHIDKSEQIEDDYIEIKVEKSESVKGLSFKYNQFIRYAPINVRQVFPNLIGYEALRNSLLKIGYNLKFVDLKSNMCINESFFADRYMEMCAKIRNYYNNLNN